MPYDFTEIEQRWQRYWLEHNTFRTDVRDTSRPKCYILDMFPYPSGSGLHIGHPEGYTATDIVARYRRHRGDNVLHPMGWDAFGLPAEQYAMKNGIHPRITTEANIANFRRQLQAIGLSYDWSREVNTTDPAYVRWTQWIFITLYNTWFDYRTNTGRPINELVEEFERSGCAQIDCTRYCGDEECCFTAEGWRAMSPLEQQKVLANFRLVYEAETPVNWCEGLGSVLANEEVDEWVEKGYTVERRPMRQWMMRITAYADRLLEGLEGLDWPAGTLQKQQEWIGRSTGAEITFATESGQPLKVFTTRADTLFGVTFITVAPEHPLLDEVTSNEERTTVEEYRRASSLKSELERQASEEKTGVFTGSYATHPLTGERVAIWTGDYVLASYGTGAVMGVPAHDERDFAFAKKFGLPIRPVIEPPTDHADHDAVMAGETCWTEAGTMVNSGEFDGMASSKGREAVTQRLAAEGKGKTTVQYKQRDWLFSRQRYWGEPIPLVHYENGIIEALDESHLPLALPDMEEFKPSGTTESPLALAPEEWLYVDHPVHGRGRRETNTMPQWAGSCWYYLRYIDPNNSERLIDPELEGYWMPVDLYIGGGEHAVLHLLYARFWHKVLFDRGYLSTPEPFARLVHQGIILGEDGGKMSKARGNVVNPDTVIADAGADALRLFEMFMGPLEMTKPWNTRGIEGIRRFLNRAWRMTCGDEEANVPAAVVDRAMTPEEERTLHATIRKVTEDIEALRFNTAISAMMVFVNKFIGADTKPRAAMEQFALLLSPLAPHIAEEIWSRLGHEESISTAPWPSFDPAKLTEDQVEIVVQVNSKIRAKVMAPVDIAAEALERLALEHEAVIPYTEGKSVRKVISVPGKLVNVIVG